MEQSLFQRQSELRRESRAAQMRAALPRLMALSNGTMRLPFHKRIAARCKSVLQWLAGTQPKGMNKTK